VVNMLYWLIYDITENNLRTKVANKCKDYGLQRVQKSSFLGTASRNKVEMLALDIKDILKDTDNCVFIFPSCKSCFGGKIIEGHFDEEKVRVKDFMIIGDPDGEKIPDSN
jgi:CRISPR-associated protein Cas2